GYPNFGLESKSPFNVMITGVRGKLLKSDVFDDFITLAYFDEAKKPIIKVYPATTDPGITHLKTPKFPEQIARGVAIVKEGHYPSVYALGYHGTGDWRHEALIQVGTLWIYRDANRDEKLDLIPSSAHPCTACGINIHMAAKKGVVKEVGDWSAGCQVIQDPRHFYEFMDIVKTSMKLYGPRVSYTLVKSSDLGL
ncbi:MAG: hypothetical protein RMM53_09905, partial [Bacteroidia bacterium]|nr:hypothetical protein [Bacteroidia bacterium]MDW8334516.1 hypothetical protein [Bacteroidia bacterium]